MKKPLLIKLILLLTMIISVPIIIYLVSGDTDLVSLASKVTNFKKEFVEETIKTSSVKDKYKSGYSFEGYRESYTNEVTDDGVSGIILGTLEYSKLGSYDWHYSYTVRPKTYCCDSYWPLIKVKDGEFGDPIAGAVYDSLGTEQAYDADQEYSRLPNRNGHLVNIEYVADGGMRNDLYKGLTYLKWQKYDTDYRIQRVLWSSWVWDVSQGYGIDYMGDNNYVLENKGVHDETAFETVKYYCGRDSYVPRTLEPHSYDAHVQYSYGGPSAVGKDSGWVAAGSVDYYDSTDTNGDGTVSIAEQLAPYGGSVSAWRAAVLAGLVAEYGPYSRSIQFATFEYQIASRNFAVASTADDIHVYVDQVKDKSENRLPSYTFGPYRISMSDGSGNYGNEMCSNNESGETLKLKELAYNEIVGGNFGQKAADTFVTAEFKVKAKYRNGTTRDIKTTIVPKYTDSTAFDDGVTHTYQKASCVPGGAVLVDAEGNALEEGFPKFDEYFYIRYYVRDDDFANTLEEIIPDISFNYLGREMKLSGYRFKSKKLAYSIHYNLCKYYGRNQANSTAFSKLTSQYTNYGYNFNEDIGQAWEVVPDGGEIYLYKPYKGGNDSADIKAAIALIEQGIANSSNRMVTDKNVKVSWGDKCMTDRDTNKILNRAVHCEGGRTKEEDRCDGIYIEGCDLHPAFHVRDPYDFTMYSFEYAAVSTTGRGFFPEYNEIDTFFNNQKQDFYYMVATYENRLLGFSYSDQSVLNVTSIGGNNPRIGFQSIRDPNALYESIKAITEKDFIDNNFAGKLIEGNKASIVGVTCHDGLCTYGCNCSGTCTCGTVDNPGCPCDECCCDDPDDPNDYCDCDYHYIKVNEDLRYSGDVVFKRDMSAQTVTTIDSVNGTQAHVEAGVDNVAIKSVPHGRIYGYNAEQGGEAYSTVDTNGYNDNGSIQKWNDYWYKKQYKTEWLKQMTTDMKTWLNQKLAEMYTEKIVDLIEKSQEYLRQWVYHEKNDAEGAYAGLYIPYIRPESNEEGVALPFVEEDNSGMQPMLVIGGGIEGAGSAWHKKPDLRLPSKKINMFLGGNVTEEEIGMKGDGYRNVVGSGGGIEVSLYNEDLKMFVAITTTDEKGNYGFQHVNPLHQYKVVFKYNGMQYLMEKKEEYTRDISDPGNKPGETGGRVNAVESGTGNDITDISPTNTGQVFTSANLNSYRRDNVNKRFTTIDAAQKNNENVYGSYTDKNNKPAKAYGWYTKIKNNNRQYVRNGTNGIGVLETSETKTDAIDYNFGAANQGAVRYADVYNKFKEISTHKDIDKDKLSTYLDLTVNGRDVIIDTNSSTDRQCSYKQKIEELNTVLGDLSENRQVINYLENTFVTAVTDYYPYKNKTRYWLETLDETKDEHKPKENYPTESIKIDGQLVINLFAGKNSTKSWVYSVYNTKTGDVKDDKDNVLTNQDQSRHVDTIFKRRITADIAIDCDISKITLKANGNVQTYDYAALKDGKIEGKDGWETAGGANLHSLEEKIQETLLNGKTGYQRAINESEYLYNASDYGLDDTRNLQVFVTYKVIVANVGSVNVRINEITDYYDSFYLQFFDSYEKEQITKDNTDFNILNPKEESQTTEAHKPATNTNVGPAVCNNMYKSLYLTNLNWNLKPTEYRMAEITFEQTKDEYGRIHLTQDLQNGTILRPDMNIFEINSYTTYGNDGDGSEIDEWRGLVTERSNVGDIESNDFYQNNQNETNDVSLYGHIKVFEDPVHNRIEYDTVQAPNVAIFVPKGAQKSTISGKTFEDIRDTDSKKAVIGNGIYDTNNKDIRDDKDKDKTIDGVTVQLVELIKWVDENGYTQSYHSKKYSDDYYVGEKIWDSTYYELEECNNTEIHSSSNDNRRWQSTPTEFIPGENALQSNVVQRYSSGTKKSRVILNVVPGGGATASYLETQESAINEGEYKFENVPPGDFVIRFIYGDTTDTVLVKDNDVTKLLNGQLGGGAAADPIGTTITDYEADPFNYGFLTGSGYIDPDGDGIKGKNDKSYNGQDYKSTIYQTNFASPNKSFKDIKGPKSEGDDTIKSDDYKDYTNYVMQNYSNINGVDMMYPTAVDKGGKNTAGYNKDGSNDKDLKATLYYFDIEQSDDSSNGKDKLSDAKDIDSFRQNSNNYAKGYINDTEYGDNIRDARLLRQNNSINGVDDSSVEKGSKNTKANKENAITLRNYRAEVLASWKEIATYTDGYTVGHRMQDEENSSSFNPKQSIMQKEMLIEFMKNTKMVSQTGVIRMQSEYNTTNTVMDFLKNMTMYNEGFIGSSTGTPEEMKNYNNQKVENDKDEYKREIVDNVDLGLVERPEAQLRLDKKVTNVKIVLSEGETLFDTSKSVNNLYFGMHKGHKYYTTKNRLKSVSVGTNTKSSPELIQAYMDGELLKGATLNISYEFTVDNIGEVDYLDRQFYYIGTPNWTDEWNIARTNADEVLDYVSNNIRFEYNTNSSHDEVLIDHEKQQLKEEYSKLTWKVKGAVPSNQTEILNSGAYNYYYVYPLGINSSDSGKLHETIRNTAAINSNAEQSKNKNDDLINREYLPDVISYNTLITTKALSTTKYDPNKKNYESRQQVKYDSYEKGANEDFTEANTVYSYGLLPTTLDKNKAVDYQIKTQLVLSSTLSEDDQSLVYPNLAEIVRMSNSVGRRAFYSTVGNQPISNQNYGNDVPTREKEKTFKKYSKYNPVDVVTPIEIDADSSQSVRILPPTGFNKNNSNLYFAIIGASAIIIVSIFMIKTGFSARRKKKRTKDIRRWM